MSKILAIAVAFVVVAVTAGCDINISSGNDQKGRGGLRGNRATGESIPHGARTVLHHASTISTTAEGSRAPSSTRSSAPTGYILDSHCAKGPGSTGLDIYYLQPPSESLRFVCVHRTDRSPYINVVDAQYPETLADVGGPYCAFSRVDQNVGCSLSPIGENDLMNVPQQADQQQPGVPAGYVLEECQQGVGATGETIYYRPPIPPQESGGMHTYWFECVHRAGFEPLVNVVASPSGGGEIVGDEGGPYCAFSTVSRNVGCALEPITSQDLMNPS